MTRVTGYKCVFQTNEERFKFALTLAGEGAGDADFVVANAEAVETLLDMFEDSSEAHFDAESGELTFAFGAGELEDEEAEDEDGDGEDEDDEGDDEGAGEDEADPETEESQEAADTTREEPPRKRKSKRSAA